MAKAFLSYSRKDFAAAMKAKEILAEQGIAVWRDEEAMVPGASFPQETGKAIQECDFFLLLWSAHSSISEFVRQEWNAALALKKKIIPCTLDETDLPAMLAATHHVPLGSLQEALGKILGLSIVTPPEPRRFRLLWIGAAMMALIGAGIGALWHKGKPSLEIKGHAATPARIGFDLNPQDDSLARLIARESVYGVEKRDPKFKIEFSHTGTIHQVQGSNLCYFEGGRLKIVLNGVEQPYPGPTIGPTEKWGNPSGIVNDRIQKDILAIIGKNREQLAKYLIARMHDEKN